MTSRDLLEFPFLRKVITARWPQLIIRGIASGVFILVILAGLFGTPVGNQNISIVLIWIAWWAALILILVPFLGRSWCSVCPLPLPGEWLQQGTVLGPGLGIKGWGKGLRWPRKLRNIWMQNGSFALMALFSAVILTKPAVTAWLLFGLIFVAVIVSLIFERRAFCRYLCPVGGFIGLYSQITPLEIRAIDSAVCKDHKQKTCYTGNENGYGCPWNIYPGGLTANTNCGACLECFRTCPYDNMTINLREWGSDLDPSGSRKFDEAFKAIIMLGSAIIYSAVMLGPWSFLKTAAFNIGSWPWVFFAGGFLLLNFILLPGLFYLAVRLAKALSPGNISVKRSFISYSATLVPLGLGAWAAFSISFLFSNGSYLWASLSDPLGWGWNLLGTTGMTWTPYISGAAPKIEAAALIIGLIGAGQTAQKISREEPIPNKYWPILLFCLGITIGLLWLLIG
jgi:hypothetical protein